jgi:hypothetical protein
VPECLKNEEWTFDEWISGYKVGIVPKKGALQCRRVHDAACESETETTEPSFLEQKGKLKP